MAKKRAAARAPKSTKKKTRSASTKKKARKAPAKRRQSATFRQRLGSLTWSQAARLLGAEGGVWLRMGADAEIRLPGDVDLRPQRCLVAVRLPDAPDEVAEVTVLRRTGRSGELAVECSLCEGPCRHQGAALWMLLDSKVDLGLAAPPDESVPLEHLTAAELSERALSDRERRAREEKMRVSSSDPKKLWTDYLVENRSSGRSYRVALRGWEVGESYCSCADFSRNRIGTCKHILKVQAKAKKTFKAGQRKRAYRRKHFSMSVSYGTTADPSVGLRLHMPHAADEQLLKLVGPLRDTVLTDASMAARLLHRLERHGLAVNIHPDAEELLQRSLRQSHLRELSAEIQRRPRRHPLRKTLLDAELLPYQLEGIAFAVGAGRAILADDMGLGKTIQAIGTAELLAREADIKRVLIVCPASLKSQWRSEIQRFCGRSAAVVIGKASERAKQYQDSTFFTICNYEQVLRDRKEIETVPFDLIILDEGQRIKNWEAKTSAALRGLSSPYRLVLSGTPLENRLGELYTVVRFVDEQLLGPPDQFFNRYRHVDDNGATVGFRRLDELRERLAPVLLRRTRSAVAKELPSRTDEVVRVTPTEEQLEIHDGQMKIVAQIAHKSYLNHIDLLRLRRALAIARMASNSTWLVGQTEPEYSSKLERIQELFEDLLADPSRKIIVFSEWRRMLDRIELRLDSLGARYVRLDGRVSQKKRAERVGEFQADPGCRVILMTNAGSTGLNLQKATTVINVDLPWNPAVLEQRIGRAHRMGQRNPVHVYKLVTEGTIEERLLDTLASKQDLSDAVLDAASDRIEVTMSTGMSDLRKKLERILDPVPLEVEDQSQARDTERSLKEAEERRSRVSEASGQLVAAALGLAGQLLDQGSKTEPDAATVDRLTERLSENVERDPDGLPQLRLTLPSDDALRSIARTLARLLGQPM